MVIKMTNHSFTVKKWQITVSRPKLTFLGFHSHVKNTQITVSRHLLGPSLTKFPPMAWVDPRRGENILLRTLNLMQHNFFHKQPVYKQRDLENIKNMRTFRVLVSNYKQLPNFHFCTFQLNHSKSLE